MDDREIRKSLDLLPGYAETGRLKFVELRPVVALTEIAENQSASYCIHWLDVTRPLEELFSALHKDSIQRKIRRADRENLEYEEGRSQELIDKFYALLLRTRRRHQLPPQPKTWFRNLADCLADAIQFRIASKDGVPIATIVTLAHAKSLIYKYGCSDERYHATGSMPFLFWRMIQDAKACNIPTVDFGRSDLDNSGLIRFKDQWGTQKTDLHYYRFPAPPVRATGPSFVASAAKVFFSRVPDSVLETIGRLVYRHIG